MLNIKLVKQWKEKVTEVFTMKKVTAKIQLKMIFSWMYGHHWYKLFQKQRSRMEKTAFSCVASCWFQMFLDGASKQLEKKNKYG